MMRRVAMYLTMTLLALSMFSCAGCKKTPPTEIPPAPPVAGTPGGGDIGRTPGTETQRWDLDELGLLKKIYFDYDKAGIRADQIDVAEADAKWLKEHADMKIIIEGHCDQRGTVEYNLGLGSRRAETVKEYMVKNGANADNIQTISKGKEELAAEGNDEAAWQQNRRVEFWSTTPPPAK